MPKKLTQAEWVERARAVHGEKYGYARVEYLGSAQKVEIVCKEHGTFWQNANNHLKGSRCPSCANKESAGKPHTANPLPSIDYLNSKFLYDRATGEFKHLATIRNAVAGRVAGSLGSEGYLRIKIGRSYYSVGRLVLHMEGVYLGPNDLVDHINGIKTDNRVKNLRVVTQKENCRNKAAYSYSVGHLGVSYRRGKYEVYIGGKYEGAYKSLEEAVKARKSAEARLGYHPNHGKPQEVRAEYSEEEE